MITVELTGLMSTSRLMNIGEMRDWWTDMMELEEVGHGVREFLQHRQRKRR